MKHRSALFLTLATAGALSYLASTSRSQPSEGAARQWKITIPSGRPLATPAVVDGRIYVGGGFGSHEFYAYDAVTGRLLWTYRTSDDGPTAAIVSDRRIIFNTESCELEVITLDGRPLWKKWLGDPLMSMPAAADGRVYIAFPNSRGDHRYYLAAFDLETGRELWRHPLSGEVITAPVIDNRRVYAATVDGSLFSFDGRDGTEIWHDAKNATSAPAIWNGQCYFSRRERAASAQQTEMVAMRGLAPAAPVLDFAKTRQNADYLDYEKRKLSRAESASQSLDASVGFAGVSKGSANMVAVSANIGQASVHGVWAYQGSKPFVDKGRVYVAMGDKVICTDPKTENVIWNRTLLDNSGAPLLNSELTPPVIVNGKIFVGSRSGDVFALSETTGDVLWKAHVGEPIVFQPAVAGGHVYVPTMAGNLYRFDTGDKLDTGWLMWGATSSHNGIILASHP
ncbi:MAG: PQQ-binding-like beta-propeller repeat protein [Bryobacteraceae bacterium]|jgi:Ca-activated chloride channel family protein